jgi:hypothetical protein
LQQYKSAIYSQRLHLHLFFPVLSVYSSPSLRTEGGGLALDPGLLKNRIGGGIADSEAEETPGLKAVGKPFWLLTIGEIEKLSQVYVALKNSAAMLHHHNVTCKPLFIVAMLQLF